MMDLHKIANTGGFGSGRAVLDAAQAKANRRKLIPKPHEMHELSLEDTGAPIAHFGNDTVDGTDYTVTANGYGSTVYSESAGHDARAFMALWNAYRDGDLVWKSDTKNG